MIHHSNHWKRRVNLFFISCILILLIGVSRLVLGAHYLSDIWAGHLIGALWLIFGIGLTEWLIASGKVAAPNTTIAGSKILSSTLAIGAFMYVFSFGIIHQHVYAPEQQTTTVQVNDNIEQLLINNNQQYTETLFGTHQQPISLLLSVNNEKKLQDVFLAAGWLPVDRTNLKNLARFVEEGMTYTRAPLASGFWNRHINSYAFVKPQIPNNKK